MEVRSYLYLIFMMFIPKLVRISRHHGLYLVCEFVPSLLDRPIGRYIEAIPPKEGWHDQTILVLQPGARSNSIKKTCDHYFTYVVKNAKR